MSVGVEIEGTPAAHGSLVSGISKGRGDISVINSARIFDYLDYGKDAWDQDRCIAAQMVEAEPVLAEQMALHHKVRESVVDAVCHSFSQVIDLGCGLPTTRRVPHERVRARWGEEARAVYVDHDLAVLAAARAWWEHPARVCGSRVHVVDLDLRHPEFLTAVLGERFDLSVPVGVVSSLTLDHLEDGEVTRFAEVLAARLAPGSGWGITHLSKVEQAARVYTAQARRQGADTRMVARAPHRLRGLFEGTGWGRWSTSVPREPFRGESPITALITLAKPT